MELYLCEHITKKEDALESILFFISSYLEYQSTAFSSASFGFIAQTVAFYREFDGCSQILSTRRYSIHKIGHEV